MSDAIAVEPAKQASKKFYKITPLGMVWTEDASYEDWEALGKYLAGMNKSMPWLIGDWIQYGEAKYGEMYTQAVETSGLEYGTLRNYKYVASRFPAERRRQGLSYSHHSEVAALEPDQADDWLQQAEAAGWSVSELRYRIAGGDVDDVIGQPNIANVPAPKEKDWMEVAKKAWAKMTKNQQDTFRAWIDMTEDALPAAA